MLVEVHQTSVRPAAQLASLSHTNDDDTWEDQEGRHARGAPGRSGSFETISIASGISSEPGPESKAPSRVESAAELEPPAESGSPGKFDLCLCPATHCTEAYVQLQGILLLDKS